MTNDDNDDLLFTWITVEPDGTVAGVAQRWRRVEDGSITEEWGDPLPAESSLPDQLLVSRRSRFGTVEISDPPIPESKLRHDADPAAVERPEHSRK